MIRLAIAVAAGILTTLVTFLLFLLCYLFEQVGLDWRWPLGIGVAVAAGVWTLDWMTEGE